ncbi:hypothetical protein D3C80_983210 [compost metagenome]
MSLTIANAKNKYVSASAYSCRSIFNAIQLSGGIPNFLDVEEVSVNASLKKKQCGYLHHSPYVWPARFERR